MCDFGRNRDVFSTDLLSEPLLRVFDSGSSDLDEPNPFHCQSSLPFNKPMLLWSSFFIINKVTGIQIIHCSVDSFKPCLRGPYALHRTDIESGH